MSGTQSADAKPAGPDAKGTQLQPSGLTGQAVPARAMSRGVLARAMHALVATWVWIVARRAGRGGPAAARVIHGDWE